MRRIWNFIIDVLDGILGGLLYGHDGGMLWTSTNAEAQNAQKLRRWAAGNRRSSESLDERAPRSPHDDFDDRMRRFRRQVNEPKDK